VYYKGENAVEMSLRVDAPYVQIKGLCQNLPRAYLVMGTRTLSHFGFIGAKNTAIGSIETVKENTPY